MGMGMTSLKWEGIGAKNLFPHISISNHKPQQLGRWLMIWGHPFSREWVFLKGQNCTENSTRGNVTAYNNQI